MQNTPGDQDIPAGAVFFCHRSRGFHDDAVIRTFDFAAPDNHIPAGVRINPVIVRPPVIIVDADVLNQNVPASRHMQRPEGGIVEGHIFYGQVPHIFQKACPGPEAPNLQRAFVAPAVGLIFKEDLPPSSVNSAAPGDGDVFGALVPVEDFDSERVERELSAFDIKEGSKEHRLLINMGLFETTRENVEVSVMFDRAHLAINRIKDDYNVHIAYYDDTLRNGVVMDQLLASQLSEAIATRQIIPYLQPIVDNKGRVLGAEALARWNHPTEGFMSPERFIPVLERNGMIADVDLHIWRCSCEVLKRWQERNIDMFISINISPKDFYFMNVPEKLIGLINEFGIKPSRLRIEITETVMFGDVDNRMKDISRLRKFGFVIEMDDFGSGFSSLNMLQDMPVDVLKIDMAFLRKAEDNPKAEMILYNIIAMAKDLELTSLTEGVESQYQFEQLSRMGCKLFQGFHFSKPIPIEEFERYCNLEEAV